MAEFVSVAEVKFASAEHTISRNDLFEHETNGALLVATEGIIGAGKAVLYGLSGGSDRATEDLSLRDAAIGASQALRRAKLAGPADEDVRWIAAEPKTSRTNVSPVSKGTVAEAVELGRTLLEGFWTFADGEGISERVEAASVYPR